MSASPVPVSEPPVSPAPRASSRRKWIIAVIVVILIASAAGGAYLLLRSQTVSLRVETTTVFATATEAGAFDAKITGTTTTAGNRLFGDRTTASRAATSTPPDTT